MKKILLLSPLFILGLTGCIEKSINTMIEPTPQVNLPVTIQPIVTRPTTPVPPSPLLGESHQVKTIQGSLLTIQERSNGFYFPQYQDKIVLLQLFGQDCQYCLKEMPFIKRMQRKYAYKLNIVALHAQNTMGPDVAQRVMKKFQIDYPLIDKDEASALLFAINNTYEWNGILPYMLLIKNGVTEYIYSGEIIHQELEKDIQSLL